MTNMKFTEDNYHRHMSVNENYIMTARRERKGNTGDLFSINGALWMLTSVRWIGALEHCKENYYLEGFNSEHELYSELRRIYAGLRDDSMICVHELVRV